MHIRVTVEHFIQKPSALICSYNCLQSCGKYFQDSLKPHCRNLLLLRHQNVKVRQWCGAIWSAWQSVLQVLPKVLDSVEVRGLCRLVKAFQTNSRNRVFFCACFMLLKRGKHFLKCNCKKEVHYCSVHLEPRSCLTLKKKTRFKWARRCPLTFWHSEYVRVWFQCRSWLCFTSQSSANDKPSSSNYL